MYRAVLSLLGMLLFFGASENVGAVCQTGDFEKSEPASNEAIEVLTAALGIGPPQLSAAYHEPVPIQYLREIFAHEIRHTRPKPCSVLITNRLLLQPMIERWKVPLGMH